MDCEGDQILARITRDLRARYGDRLEEMFLIGSRAGGIPHLDSDWDVVVILTDARPMLRIDDVPIGPMNRTPLRYDDGVKVDVIPLAPSERELDHWLPRAVREVGIRI